MVTEFVLRNRQIVMSASDILLLADEVQRPCLSPLVKLLRVPGKISRDELIDLWKARPLRCQRISVP